MKIAKHIERLPDFRDSNRAAYVAGFVFSVALTAAAFILVWAYQASGNTIFSRGLLIGMLAILASIQLVVQILFFLHLSADRRIRWNLYAAIFTGIVVLTIVIGSIWIMQNLDYNMSHESRDITHETELDEGITR